jgi:hypothetical protein
MTPYKHSQQEKETAHCGKNPAAAKETTRLVLVLSCSESHTPGSDHRYQKHPKATKISSMKTTLSVRPLLPASLSSLVSAPLLAFWNR